MPRSALATCTRQRDLAAVTSVFRPGNGDGHGEVHSVSSLLGGPTLAGTPILMYHGLTQEPAPATRFEVTRAALAEHLEAIESAGREVASLDDWWDGHTSHPSVVITFDDGHESDFELAFPLLVDKGASATFFVCPSFVGQADFMTWEQILEMRDAGFSFQSHGLDHVALSLLSEDDLRDQLRRSKDQLESRLGARVRFLAAPYGLLSRRVVEAALEEGYEAVCTSTPWPARTGGRTINRVSIQAATTADQYTSLVAGRPGPYLRKALRRVAAHIPRQILLQIAPDRLGVRVPGSPS